MKRLLLCLFTLPILAFLLASCGSSNKTLYAKEYLDSNKVNLSVTEVPVPLIQPYDFININFYGNSAAVTSMMNNFGGVEVATAGSGSSTSAQLKNGYQVSADGYLDLPQLGKIKASGMTIEQLKKMLTEKAKEKLQEPTVLVKFANFKITMLGEVRSQGSYTVPNDKITILEALGTAGDVTLYALKDKVKIIREENGNRTMGTIDLTSKSLFSSEYFYLRPNDVVYVPSNGQQERSLKVNNYLPYLSLGLTVISLIITLINIFK